jgi:hypothetical protein
MWILLCFSMLLMSMFDCSKSVRLQGQKRVFSWEAHIERMHDLVMTRKIQGPEWGCNANFVIAWCCVPHPLLCGVDLLAAMLVVLMTQLAQVPSMLQCIMVDDSCCAIGGECRHDNKNKIYSNRKYNFINLTSTILILNNLFLFFMKFWANWSRLQSRKKKSLGVFTQSDKNQKFGQIRELNCRVKIMNWEYNWTGRDIQGFDQDVVSNGRIGQSTV